MKKLVALLLAAAMAFTCVACGGGNTDNGGSSNGGSIKDANEILTKVWDKFDEGTKFPIGGGNGENAVMDTPAAFDLSAEGAKDELLVAYCVPNENAEMIDGAATMMNMMMANNFTCGAYHVKEAANVEKVVAGIKEATVNNQWMCGTPDVFMIVTVDDSYVVSAFGNAQAMEAFKTAITGVYGDAAVISVEENIAK